MTTHAFVITRHSIRNYGSVLQAYATRELLSREGCASTIVDYRQDGVDDTGWAYAPKGRGLLAHTKSVVYSAIRHNHARRRGVVFEDFVQSELPMTARYHSTSELGSSAEFDSGSVYCVGSDQVWNIEYNRDNRPYYLSFSPDAAQRFSLSSSIGMSSLPHREETALVEALAQFSGISVREVEAADYLTGLGLDVHQHVDPTLALSASDWNVLATERLDSDTPYVLVYQLNGNRELEASAAAVAKDLGARVVRLEYWPNLRGRGSAKIVLPSVPRFLSLFRDAAFVVTDSFHGCAFSVNFGRPFATLHPPRYGNRIASLLDLVGLPHRSVSSGEEARDLVRTEPHLPSLARGLAAERERLSAYIRGQLA